MSIFSERLKWLREKKGFTQKEMAERLGMSGSSYSKYEYGLREPNLETLAKLPGILGESADFLLGVTNLDFKSQKKYTSLLSKFKVYKERQLEIFKLRFDPENMSEDYREYRKLMGLELFEDFIRTTEERSLQTKLEIIDLCTDLLETITVIPFLGEEHIVKIKYIESELK